MFKEGAKVSAKKAAVVFVFILSFLLAMKGLDNAFFWDDEAQVAIAAKNFLATGKFTGWDGRSLFAYHNGALLDRSFHLINPPLDYFVTAVSFRILGVSTRAGRIPYVFAGMLSLILFALVLRHDFRNLPPPVRHSADWLRVYAFSFFALSTVFLLNIRQCRYYALSLLFSLLTTFSYKKCLATKRPIWFVLGGMGAGLLFFSHYLVCAAFIFSLAGVHLIFHRKELRINDFPKVLLGVSVFAMATLPYAFNHRVWDRPDFIRSAWFPEEPWLTRKIHLIGWTFNEINLISAFPWMVALLLLALLVIHRREKELVRTALEWAALGGGVAITIAFLSPEPAVRYILAATPYFSGLVGVFLWFIHRWKKSAAIFTLALLVCCNAAALYSGNKKFQWLLPSYIREVTATYPTSSEAVVKYLKKHAQQDDLVYALPEYFNYPLMFYAGNRVKICCLLDERGRFSKKDLRNLNAPLFVDEHFPHWIIAFGLHHKNLLPAIQFFSRPRNQGRKTRQYRYKQVAVLNVYWFQTQHPELRVHSFGPRTDFDPRTRGVYVFKRFGD